MDPQTIAAMTVNVIGPHLAKAGEALVKEVGQVALDAMKSIYSTVKEALAGDSYAEETLERLEEDPQSESRLTALESLLEERLQADQEFAATLQGLLEEAKEAGVEDIVQQVTVSGQARTGDITQIGKIEGDVDLSKSP